MNRNGFTIDKIKVLCNIEILIQNVATFEIISLNLGCKLQIFPWHIIVYFNILKDICKVQKISLLVLNTDVLHNFNESHTESCQCSFGDNVLIYSHNTWFWNSEAITNKMFSIVLWLLFRRYWFKLEIWLVKNEVMEL